MPRTSDSHASHASLARRLCIPYFEAAKDLLCQVAELNRLEKLFNDFSGECFLICLLRKQFHDLSSMF